VAEWLLRGAQRLTIARNLPETTQHRAVITKWRYANNSALQFLTDPAACEVDPTAETKGADLYEKYRAWAAANGVRAFGRNNFFEALDEGAGRSGVIRDDRREGVVFTGVRLRP
jgi:phage/plasmid-associated DNA primase